MLATSNTDKDVIWTLGEALPIDQVHAFIDKKKSGPGLHLVQNRDINSATETKHNYRTGIKNNSQI